MKQKILGFLTSSLITLFVMLAFTLITSQSFLSDVFKVDTDSFTVFGITYTLDKNITGIFAKLLSFNEELFGQPVFSAVKWICTKTFNTLKTALLLCIEALRLGVGL